MELTATPGPHVLVDDLDGLAVAEEDWHHLRRVLRVRTGDALSVSDGHGSWRTAVMTDEGVEATGPIEMAPRPRPVSIGFALVKGAKPDLIVQKLTELGVSEIVPFVAARSVVQWDDAKQSRNHERLERIARAATMQSKGAWLPTVLAVARFGDLVANVNVNANADGDVTHAGSGAVVRADIGAPRLAVDGSETRRVLVGPEGGWSDEERRLVPGAVGLHTNVLRAETAAIAVGVLLTCAGG